MLPPVLLLEYPFPTPMSSAVAMSSDRGPEGHSSWHVTCDWFKVNHGSNKHSWICQPSHFTDSTSSVPTCYLLVHYCFNFWTCQNWGSRKTKSRSRTSALASELPPPPPSN